jgi:hypothetical protein
MVCKREVNYMLFECPKLARRVRIALLQMTQCGSRFGDTPVLAGFECEGAGECGVKGDNQVVIWSKCVHPLCPH